MKLCADNSTSKNVEKNFEHQHKYQILASVPQNQRPLASFCHFALLLMTSSEEANTPVLFHRQQTRMDSNYMYLGKKHCNNSGFVIPIPVSTYVCSQQLKSHILLGLLKGILGNVGALTKVFISCLFFIGTSTVHNMDVCHIPKLNSTQQLNWKTQTKQNRVRKRIH